MEAIEAVRTMRAVRRYDDRPIPDEDLRRVLEAARWTGSSKNGQPWEVVVVRDRATLAELAACGPYAGHLAGAVAAVVLVVDGAIPAAEFDAGRLSQSLMLAAWALGIGSCIASLYPEENERRARALLGVPEGLAADTAIALGYPAGSAALRFASAPPEVRSAVTPGRKPAERFAHWERYRQAAP